MRATHTRLGEALELIDMPLPQATEYTAQDYWNLPEGTRAELIGSELYSMAPPSRTHQAIVTNLAKKIGVFIDANGGPCEVYVAPLAVNLNADDSTYVEPDVMVICDPSKLNDRGCNGAPDLVVEVVSPSSRRMDYATKTSLYMSAEVREYWVVDPEKAMTTVFLFEQKDFAPVIYPFATPVPVGIYDEKLQVTMAQLVKQG